MVGSDHMVFVHPYHRWMALQSFQRLKHSPSGKFDGEAIDQRQIMQDAPTRLVGHLLPNLHGDVLLKDHDLPMPLHRVGESHSPEAEGRYHDADESFEPFNSFHPTPLF